MIDPPSSVPESARGAASALTWKTYSVRASDKAPLLKFILDALTLRGCRIISTTHPGSAPFYIVFETPGGERQALLAYAFLANAVVTQNRPVDEHRFQIKYGGELRGVLEVAIDPGGVVTTIFLGIDLARGVFIAGDPVMNNPSPMSRSVEFKAQNVDEIERTGWAAWERDRKPPKTKNRPTAMLDEDTRIQILVGGRQERLLDLIQLERLARGLDPGERHLLADRLGAGPQTVESSLSHRLLDELDIPSEALFDLIDGASRLKMAVRGWVAESHLETQLRAVPGVTDCVRLEGDGVPDLSLRWKGGAPILIECKNVLRRTDAAGRSRVDFQRTRASKADPCSRYYQPGDFPILAACLHAVSESWEFRFALTTRLAEHRTCAGRIASNVVVDEPVFTARPELVFDWHAGFQL